MSYCLNSLQGVIEGILWESTIGDIKGYTSLDSSSYELPSKLLEGFLYRRLYRV